MLQALCFALQVRKMTSLRPITSKRLLKLRRTYNDALQTVRNKTLIEPTDLNLRRHSNQAYLVRKIK
jgi:hypothetical protein